MNFIITKRVEESYQKAAAKSILSYFLKVKEKQGEPCELHPFKWRPNYGVFVDLPFYATSDPYYFELSKGLLDYEERQNEKDPLKWFKPNFKGYGRLLFQPDLCIFHKGTPVFLIYVEGYHESVNLDEVENARQFFEGHSVEVHVIHAKDILNLACIPSRLNTSQLI